MKLTGIWLSVTLRFIIFGLMVCMGFVGIVKLIKCAWYL